MGSSSQRSLVSLCSCWWHHYQNTTYLGHHWCDRLLCIQSLHAQPWHHYPLLLGPQTQLYHPQSSQWIAAHLQQHDPYVSLTVLGVYLCHPAWMIYVHFLGHHWHSHCHLSCLDTFTIYAHVSDSYSILALSFPYFRLSLLCLQVSSIDHSPELT